MYKIDIDKDNEEVGVTCGRAANGFPLLYEMLSGEGLFPIRVYATHTPQC